MIKPQSGISVAIYLTLALLIIRLILDTLGVGIDGGVRIYPVLLGLLVASYLGLRSQRMLVSTESPKELSDLTFIMEIRAAIRPAALLSFLYSVFLYGFYTFINPSLFPKEVEKRKEEYREAFEANNISPEEAEQVLENFTTFTDFVFDPLNWATLSLFALVMLSALYGFMLTAIARKFPEFIRI